MIGKVIILLLLAVGISFSTVPSYATIGGSNAGYSRSYAIEKVTDNVFAAIAQPRGKAASNAVIVVTGTQVVIMGAHFVPDSISELMEEVGKITTAPVATVILTHHHRGYNYVDYDFPLGIQIVTSWQTWQTLKESYRELKNPVIFFDKSLTLRLGKTTIVASNLGRGHGDGDVVVYLPEEKVLFTSDLFFNNVIGYMGDGYLREWVLNLEMLEGLDTRFVVPGLGKVTDSEAIGRFRVFFTDFTTEMLHYLEKKKTLEQTKKNFRLPKYESLPGYREFFNQNIERAYRQLKDQ
ncbi:MBL fold metallo-hydrolase [Geotalea sp. SG265]|uniref:MBL fold metallo-hydrolase n=1 Tax=Geotalea sp. SG265 TaxID=2922867 RepID=UPI001FAF44B1|nr:MBL fold metallo-hydrolase [Geotalea sp. SG265]